MNQLYKKTILFLFVSLSFFISITNAAYAAMSIDLGSQSIKIGLVKPGVPMEIVLNKESKRKTPFVIGIKNNTRYFGEAAVQYAVKNPKNVFFGFFDLIGKKIDNPVVVKYQDENPHLTLVSDEKRETVVFKTDDGNKYAVETLLAMILQNIRDLCKAYANQLVKDVVITIPPYFNQAERMTVAAAAEIAGLNVLQLLTEGSAIGLNYGVFRYKSITEQPQNLLIYDIGYSKTICTIVEFRLTKEKYPIVSTIGIGYDRTFGGNELTLRLRNHLVNEFNKIYKSDNDITKDPKAMAKLYKEAERVKTVLSANNDHYAHIENLFESKDFRVQVTREQFHELFADIESNYFQSINDALRMAELDSNQIDLMVLMGAGSRVPRLQQLLQERFQNKEIGRFLNTDEAITMGALYQSAHLSNGFKVKKFGIQELQIFPVQVSFTPGNAAQDQQTNIQNRILYAYRSIYPVPTKVILFKSHVDDFNFNLNYGSLSHLSTKQLMEFGSLNVSEILLKGLGEVIKTKATETVVFKNVKVYFEMNQLGIVDVKQAEALFESNKNLFNSTLSAIADTIGQFFSGSNTAEKNTKDNLESGSDKSVKNSTNTQQNLTETIEKDKKVEEKKNLTSTDEKQNNKTVSATPKILKVPLTLETKLVFKAMTADEIKEQIKILADFELYERKKLERDNTLNTLETNIYNTYENLDNTEYTRFGTESEITDLTTKVKLLKEWLDEDVDVNTPFEEIVEKKNELNNLLKKIKYRKQQFEARTPLIEELEKVLNNPLNKVILESKSLLADIDITSFEKLITETKSWLTEKKDEQNKLFLNEDPILKVVDLKEKITAVDREMRYLSAKLYAQKLKIEQENLKKMKEEAAAKAENESKNKENIKENDNNNTTDNTNDSPLNEEKILKETDLKEENKEDEQKENAGSSTHDQTEL